MRITINRKHKNCHVLDDDAAGADDDHDDGEGAGAGDGDDGDDGGDGDGCVTVMMIATRTTEITVAVAGKGWSRANLFFLRFIVSTKHPRSDLIWKLSLNPHD